MSIIEDVGKALQSVVAPELKAINERISSVEKVMELRFDAVNQRLDALLQQLALDRRLSAVERELDDNRKAQ